MFSKKSKLFLLLFLILSFVIVIAGTAKSYSHTKPLLEQTTLEIATGDSINKILSNFPINSLEQSLLKIFLYTNNIHLIQAGHYDVQSKTWSEIFVDFSEGNIKEYRFKIQEGTNIFDLKKLLLSSKLKLDCPNFNCLNNQLNFTEGTLMPETYFYNFNSPASNILIKSQDSFIEYAELLWEKKQPSNPLKTLDEAIILASIVEKEAGNNKEKPIIAGVFLNRLNLNMRLQADPTIIYGLLPNFNGNITKLNLQDSSNKYNTYKIKGLPPTPIAMISKSSLEAVILGIPNNYVYFVAKGDGTHYFSTIYADHLKAVRKFQLNKS
ncbi:endolytic transglycosylase MltG [Gammaproteobacteria bacterium]|nr:endolytic transglycosylase MltG [Gammaproteobacteria bacterium]MDC3380123.1 endolytic transglycosylase MltG [Gammaproteobacteria bacterium]